MNTLVTFRKFPEGDVIALFPEIEDTGIYIQSYMHVGQHGGASPDLIDDLDKAKSDEYSSLKSELERIGYKLEVV